MCQWRGQPHSHCKAYIQYSQPRRTKNIFKLPSGPPSYQPQQHYGDQYKLGYPTLRPPPLNTGYPSSGHSMNRTSSHGSSDSGYATGAPSVASPIPQQSYPIQGYPVQSYPVQSYVPNRQLSQQSGNYSYGIQRSPNIEVFHAAPVSSSKHKKERRLR